MLALTVAALAAWNVVLLTGDDPARAYTHTYNDDEGRALRLEGEEGAGVFNIRFEGLPARPPSETYELWVIREGDWLSVGRFNANASDAWSGSFSFDFHEGDILCVTVQSAEVRDEPFGEPLIWSPL